MTYETLIPVQATRPPAAWKGGKHLLAKRLDKLISAIPHTTYAEPFVGMGGVFFKRTARPKGEVINDINGDIINLFRILREHYPQFMDCLKFQITSRDEFERLLKLDGTALTDLQRAARFLYLHRNGFGGKLGSKSFGTAVSRAARFDVNKLGPMLADIHERLSSVILECMPYDRFIGHYDKDLCIMAKLPQIIKNPHPRVLKYSQYSARLVFRFSRLVPIFLIMKRSLTGWIRSFTSIHPITGMKMIMVKTYSVKRILHVSRRC